MAKVSTNKMLDVLTEDWGNDSRTGLPYSGEAVREALQAILTNHDTGKVGCIKWSSTVDSSNYYHVWGFKDEASYREYVAGDKEDETVKALLLIDEALPISTVQGDSYAAYLFTTISSSKNLVVAEKKLEIPLRFHAVRTSSGDRLNMGAKGTLVVQRKSGTGSWTTVGEMNEVLDSIDYTNTEEYQTIDIGPYLTDGSQQVRLQGRFAYTDGEGKEQTQVSTYVLVGASVTKANLDIACQQNWQTPILASTYKDRGFPISYMVYGAVEKTLHVEITGGGGTTLSLEYALTAAQDSATITKNISDSTDTYKLWKHGVRAVKAWLTCDDGLGSTLTSKVLVNRFMVVNPTTDADKTTPYIMLQNVATECDNYAQADLCQYAVFSPGTDGTANDGADVTAVFYLTAYAETFPDDNPTQYFRIENVVSPGTQNTLNTTVEIESEDEEATAIPAYFRVWRKDGDEEVNFMLQSMGLANTVISVDNSESYAPKSGADFVLNPKTRNNSESNPQTIINAKTGATIESTWEGFGMTKDGWIASDEDGQRVLRVPAGAKVNFKYNPFSQFLATADSSLEIELDFKVRNVTNEDDPIVSLFEDLTTTDSSGSAITTFRGIKMLPLKGEIHTKSNAVSSETDFNWREGVRTHISFNIHNAVAPNKGDALVPNSSTYDTSATKIALVRVFINGDIEREFKYSVSDTEEFCTAAMSNGGFTIGQSGADIDIYGIRIYQNTALESGEVLNDYISTLPTTAEKQAMRKRNDILSGGKVDMAKARALGIRCLVWHGTEPYKENTSTQKGYYEVFQYDAKGNYLAEYSGTIGKATASMPTKRQGSTANTYYYSNIQTKVNDMTETINVPLSELHSSITYEVKTAEDGSKTVALCGGCLGKNFPTSETAVEYPYIAVNGADGVVVPDGWVDGNGKYRGQCYQLNGEQPYAQKLVNKINYASSMQSHLPGVNNLYNDLHKTIVGMNSLQEGYDKARVSKYTEPFLFFTQALDSDTPIYRGPCAFGAGKMDKPTWGYAKKLHPLFAMFEGSDNNYDLTDMRVPFTCNMPDCPENITYSADDEGFFYNGQQCIDFDAGDTEDDDTPKASIIAVLQDAWNFLYLHSPEIAYYKGTFDKFQVADEAKDTFKKYWCTDGSDAYLLKRYDYVNQKWVDAGLWDDTAKAWAKVDLRTDSMTKATYEGSSNQSEYKALNTELQGAIVAHAKKYIGWYFKTSSLQLYYTFVIHMMAGTDSCSKNTYYVIDPKAVDVEIDGETKTCYLLEMHTDDVDTMLPIDNNGRTTKPYYIDRMHPYVDGDTTTEKYEGMHNVLFNLCEQMWEGTKELQSMAKRILTAMESLVSETDYIEGFPSSGQKASVIGCLWKYIYFIQAYIPQVAYNEAARIRYEYPEMLGFVSYGSGARGVRPITQSNGSLMQCELQFIERRIVLMASYAAWGPFGDGKTGNLGISDATESFSMQAFHLPDSASSLNKYQFTVKPHQYIYPTGMLGQTTVDPHKRIAPGEAFILELGSTTSNDTGMSIAGINYYRSIGNVGDLSTTPSNTITVNGKRLVEFTAEPSATYVDGETGVETPAFRPGALAITAKNIEKFSVKGCTATGGSVDLSSLNRLVSVDARQTKLSAVTLPETHTLTEARLPDTVTSVNVTNNASLQTLTLEGYGNLTRYVVKNNAYINTYPHVLGIYKANAPIKTLAVENVNWTDSEVLSADMMMWLAAIPASLTGVIGLKKASQDRYLNLSEKITLGRQYGNIDSTDNALYVTYTSVAINTITISGDTFCDKTGEYQYTITASPVSGNNIAVSSEGAKLKWTLPASADPYAHWEDDVNGLLMVDALSDPDLDQKHTMGVTAELITGSTLTAEKQVGFYRHTPKVGDFAYADGTFDGDWDETRDFIGLVFMRLPLYGDDGTTLIGYDVRVVAKENLNLMTTEGKSWTSHRWGLYPNNDQGFLSEETAIEDAAGVTDAFDIDTLTNITTRWNGSQVVDTKTVDGGTYNGVNYDYINDTTYLDADQADGYKAINAGAALSDYNGRANTEKIVAHAKAIVEGYLGRSWPTTLTELADAMQLLVSENSTATNSWRYEEFYYPAAWGCALYEPTTSKGTPSDSYKAGNWYLPGCGEQGRIYNFYRQGTAADSANFDAASEAVTPVIANAASKAGKSVMAAFSGWFWTSSEGSRGNSWNVGGSGYVGNGTKYFNSGVRPCSAFTFIL